RIHGRLDAKERSAMSTAPQVDRTSSGPDLDLCYLPATEAIEAFKSRTLSPVELMEAVIARSEQVNPTLNAITYTYFDRALEQAREAERVYRDTNATPRALEGIPTA